MNKKLIIIYYHEIVNDGDGYHYQKIDRSKFIEQMKFLSEQGYNSIFFSELNYNIPEKSIIVSFDDGFRSVYNNAFPIMKRYKIKGNIYLPTAFIGQDDKFLNWEMVNELIKSGYYEMQAHTHNHLDIRTLNYSSLLMQIQKSDEMFQNKLGYLPDAFCMPYGTYNRKSLDYLRSTNRYKFLLGSYYGRVNPSKLDKMVIPRIGISNNDSLDVFRKKLDGNYDWKGPLQKLRLFYKNKRNEFIMNYEY